MKRVLIGAKEEEILSTLEVILKHWGYRVTVSSDVEDLKGLLGELSYHLLILESKLLQDLGDFLPKTPQGKSSQKTTVPLLLLKNDDTPITVDIPFLPLDIPINVFSLFALIQKYLEKKPRQNLRLTVKLPGMFSMGETSNLAEVLSLSARGLFIKTGARLEKGHLVNISVPLMGMKRELEIAGRILYCIEPGPANNYTQGYGIEFIEIDVTSEEALKRYIETSFFGEIAGKTSRTNELTWDQLANLPGELGLNLIQTT